MKPKSRLSTAPIQASKPSKIDFGEYVEGVATASGMPAVLQSRRLLMSAYWRVCALDPVLLNQSRVELLTRATGICAEEAAEAVVEAAAQHMDRTSKVGMVDLLQGPATIEMGDIQMELQGANVIFRRGHEASEVDGVVAIGNAPKRLAIYDVTTSPSYLASKLEGGEPFFQGLRQEFADQFGIALEKWHILMDYERSGQLNAFDRPVMALRAPRSALPESGVHVLALPLQRYVRQMRGQVLALLYERNRHFVGDMAIYN